MRSIMKVWFVLTMAFCSPSLANAQTPTPAADKVPPKSTSKVSVKYDKSKDTTLVILKSMTITRNDQEKEFAQNFPSHQMEFESLLSYKGQFPGAPVGDVILRFRCVSSTYIFLRGQELKVIADRKDPDKARGFSLGFTDYKSMAPKFNTVYEEIMEIKAPPDAIFKFADARTLEFFFGPIVYQLTPKQQDAIKDFKSFLPDSAPPK